MEIVKVLVNVDQRLAVLSGKREHGTCLVALDPTNLTEAQRQVLVESSNRKYLDAYYLYPQIGGSICLDVPMVEATEASVIEVLNHRVQLREQKRQQLEADHEKAVAAYLDTPPEKLYRTASSFIVDGKTFTSSDSSMHRWDPIHADRYHFGVSCDRLYDDERTQEHQAKVKVLCAAHNAEVEEKIRENP